VAFVGQSVQLTCPINQTAGFKWYQISDGSSSVSNTIDIPSETDNFIASIPAENGYVLTAVRTSIDNAGRYDLDNDNPRTDCSVYLAVIGK